MITALNVILILLLMTITTTNNNVIVALNSMEGSQNLARQLDD